MTALRLVLCTVSERDSLRVAHALVEEQLAACVNIVPDLTSVYRWQGEVCEDKEALLLIKTRADVVPDLTELIRTIHSYAVPEVITLPLSSKEGNTEYLAWLIENVPPGKDEPE